MAARMSKKEADDYFRKNPHGQKQYDRPAGPERKPGQKVTTYYKEAKANEEGLRHHEERRESNRQRRYAHRHDSVTKQYDEPAGPSRRSMAEKVGSGFERIMGGAERAIGNISNSRVVGKVKERSREIAEESRRPAPRSRGKGRGRRERMPASMGITDPGIGSGFMHIDPFGIGGGYPSSSSPAPRRKKSRRRPAQSYGGSSSGGLDMMHVPDHMRWMFGMR
jgi:hypothetical protein